MLAAEENKLMKKIQNTRKWAEEILEIKKRNEQKFEKKIHDKQLEESKVERARQRHSLLRQQWDQIKSLRKWEI